MARRQIIKIDQEKCDGCGKCVPSCAGGAIRMVDGKAQLVAEKFCDGLGVCLGACPQGALLLEEREVEEFEGPAPGWPVAREHKDHESPAVEAGPAFVCPGSQMRQFSRRDVPEAGPSALSHWPVKLRLVDSEARFLQGAELLVAADCTAFAAGDFHARFLSGRAVVCSCPKFESLEESAARLTAILKENDIRGLTIVNMEVPCCQGLTQVVRQALVASGKVLPVTICTLGVTGQVVQQQRIKGK
jgi:Fe-S-cluster-containing hydrogenase component 2